MSSYYLHQWHAVDGVNNIFVRLSDQPLGSCGAMENNTLFVVVGSVDAVYLGYGCEQYFYLGTFTVNYREFYAVVGFHNDTSS